MPKSGMLVPKRTQNKRWRNWSQMRSYTMMGRLAATGSWRPPEWYYAMRVSPPPVRRYRDFTHFIEYKKHYDELRQRFFAANPQTKTIGRNMFNNFWLEKPVEKLLRKYEDLRKAGKSHSEAFEIVTEEYDKVCKIVERHRQLVAEKALKNTNVLSMKDAQAMLREVSQQKKGGPTNVQQELGDLF
eukprot:TRINITY_DN47318_c0_g2_i1.p1 TRINITY_DN47318_c0_g2~~TRINITY_DN47318_c0_g2_i1.p1  ORF type:complete len:186 (+),score=18.79 TRINITY_DN47318_c0_g2_i1:42-599(+)